MFELLAVFALLAVGVAAVALFAVGALVFKLLFKVALLPLTLLGLALKLVLVVVGIAVAAVVLPVVLGVGLVLVVPALILLAVGGVIWAGVALVGALT
jgi:hypothetical protein